MRSPPLNGILLAWILIGLGLRFFHLDAKPAWGDEWATIVFSLGHSFRAIALDQLLTIDQLLAPAHRDGASWADGIRHLMTESTHPPLYFVLSHFWINLWQRSGTLIDLGVARSLSVLFGVLTIPVAYGLAWATTRSRWIAQTAAALMAVSPFGVYLAQDARHYTLAMLLGMGSLACFLRFIRTEGGKNSGQAVGLGMVWAIANGLGFATHFFVGLLLLAEATVLAGAGLFQRIRLGRAIYLAAAGTLLLTLPWLVVLAQIPGDRLTDWVHKQDLSLVEQLAPIGRLMAWLVTMVAMPLVEGSVGMAIASSLVLFGLLGWAGWQLVRTQRPTQRPTQLPTQQRTVHRSVLWGLVTLLGAELGWILIATYGFQRDLTLGARYLFSLLPVVGLGLAIALDSLKAGQRQRVLSIVLVLGLVGSGAIAQGLAYGKPDRSDLVVQDIQAQYRQTSPMPPLLIATVYKTHEQTGEIMSLAYEWQRNPGHPPEPEPRFLLAQREPVSNLTTAVFQRALVTMPQPFDLWLVNWAANLDFGAIGCAGEPVYRGKVPGYRYKRYLCRSRLLAEG